MRGMVGMRAGTVGTFLLLVMGIGFSSPAFAAVPPKAFLHSGNDRQRGHSSHFTRGSHHGGGKCSVMHGDGFLTWPNALEHESGKKLRIGFRRDDKPVEVDLDDYRKVSEEGYTKGKRRAVPFKLRPRRKDGEVVGWRVLFRRDRSGHHYLTLHVRWEGEHECDFDEAPYNFHAKTS